MYRVIHNDKVVYESYDLEDCEDFIDYELKQDGCTIEEFTPCRCGEEGYLRYDWYGIPTGNFCDDCYENNYPYRKDRYETIEHDGYGERLDDYE
jgi:hypothetical protein